MRNIFRLALNDPRLILKDRTSVLWLILFPIALMWFFGQMGGSGTNPSQPHISLTVDDQDGGWLARALVAELASDQVTLMDLASMPASEAISPRIRTLVIPAGFTQHLLAGEKQTLRLKAEPGSATDFGLAAQVHILRAGGRTLGRLAEVEIAGLAPEQGESAADARIRAFRALGERPPLIQLDVSSAGRGRPVPAGRAQSVPGMLTMMVMMMTLIQGAIFLTIEKQEGMLRRQSALPISRGQIFAGKLLGRFLIAALQTTVLILAGRFLFGVLFGNSPLALLLLLATYCLAVAGLSTLLGSLLSTPEQAESVGWILSMLLAALGGCWWSSELMPKWLWTAAHMLPTAWAMDGFHALISFGYGLEGVWLPVLVLTGFGIATAVLGARVLRYD